VNIDDHPERNWDWRQPQFLAGFINPPLPDRIGVAGPDRIEFATPESAAYLWYGWSPAEQASRWTEGNEATLVFRVDAIHELLFTMKLHAFVIPNQHPQQRLSVKLNGSVIENLSFKDSEPHEISLILPVNMLLPQNTLQFSLPDAASPKSLRLGEDTRQLGIAVYWIRFSPEASGQAPLAYSESLLSSPRFR
jgi:hypothetical protein